MKANEIRIGNYYDNNGETKKVSPNTIEEVWNAERTWVKPIPLTEEWLLKFEFENIYDEFLFNNGYFDLIFNDNRVSLRVEGQWLSLDIEYVHQLQNLYFALTNEELTINL